MIGSLNMSNVVGLNCWLDTTWHLQSWLWAAAHNKNVVSLWLYGDILNLIILPSCFSIQVCHPRIVSLKDYDLFRVFCMTDLSLFAISLYLLGNNVPSCHRQHTHCHRSNSAHLLIVLIIRNTDNKSWDAHFHTLWRDFTVQMCNSYCLIITQFLYIYIF